MPEEINELQDLPEEDEEQGPELEKSGGPSTYSVVC
jgi:hypothetical protein